MNSELIKTETVVSKVFLKKGGEVILKGVTFKEADEIVSAIKNTGQLESYFISRDQTCV